MRAIEAPPRCGSDRLSEPMPRVRDTAEGRAQIAAEVSKLRAWSTPRGVVWDPGAKPTAAVKGRS